MNYGVQLYSVRREIESLGLDAVLEAIARAGYEYVELAGTYSLTPEEFAAKLNKYGLKVISAHVGAAAMDAFLPFADVLKPKAIILPWFDCNRFDTEKEKAVDEIKAMKEKVDSKGAIFAYHNHAAEYANGNDRVAEVMEAVEGTKSQLDIFWVTAAGKDPLETMDKYGEKLWCLHVKEMDSRTKNDPCEYPNVIVGTGKSKSKECIEKAVKMGIDTFILEVEGFSCPMEEYLKESLIAMKTFAEEK